MYFLFYSINQGPKIKKLYPENQMEQSESQMLEPNSSGCELFFNINCKKNKKNKRFLSTFNTHTNPVDPLTFYDRNP